MPVVKKWNLCLKSISIERTFFCLGILLKQFYIFPSGSLGLADFCFGISALIMLAKRLYKQQGLGIEKKDWTIYGFLICVMAVNGIYWLLIKHPDSIKYSIYWSYAIMIIWSFRQIGTRTSVLQVSAGILKLSILFQTAIWLLGYGRTYYEYWGATRFMGTFNNPNQMAYVIFLILLLLYFYEPDKKKFWLFGIMAGILIGATKSTGVFLGWVSLAFFDGLIIFYRLSRKRKGYRICWGIFWCCIAVGVPLFLWLIWPESGFLIEKTNYSLIARIQEKIYKVWTGGLKGLVYDRGWERMILYPQYLLYGAGEGNEGRFSLAVWQSEIHSTLFSIWFCYGIGPLLLFVRWLYDNLKQVFVKYWPVYAALFLECITVINYRQPFFWLVLLAGPMLVTGGKNSEQGKKI